MSETTAEPGTTYLTGIRIEHQHCGRCGADNGTQQQIFTDRVESLATTPCCGSQPCKGDVTTDPWLGCRTGRQVWACCLAVAERCLGEPVTLTTTAEYTPEETL